MQPQSQRAKGNLASSEKLLVEQCIAMYRGSFPNILHFLIPLFVSINYQCLQQHRLACLVLDEFKQYY